MQNLALSNNTVESSRKNRARTKHYADLGDNNLYMNNLSLATKLGYEYLCVYYIYIYISSNKNFDCWGCIESLGISSDWFLPLRKMFPGGLNLHKKFVDIS